MAGSITNFMAAISANGGMSMTNGYDIEFDFSGLTELNGVLQNYNIKVPEANDAGNPGSLINMFCDEAQLPNSQAATGQVNGRYLGEGQKNYPHTRLLSDFSLTWMCDANMAPYKFLLAWHNYIFSAGLFNEYPIQRTTDSLKNFKNEAKERNVNRSIRLKYPNQYQAVLRIAKTERGKTAPNSRVPLVYVIEKCFPYSVDAVPLSYGTSQITKVTGNFYYTTHSIYTSDVRKFEG